MSRRLKGGFHFKPGELVGLYSRQDVGGDMTSTKRHPIRPFLQKLIGLYQRRLNGSRGDVIVNIGSNTECIPSY
nr:hypothetical protein PIKIBBIB_00075 [Gallid alphaherpesvirus 2]WOL21367.1 hypothetical protein IICANGFA_00082 [Gallid alphaherpesvirus 2]WOL21767.1 hypothetical protein DMEEGDKK_00081 [Gallid alphaherpesvirus 2]